MQNVNHCGGTAAETLSFDLSPSLSMSSLCPESRDEQPVFTQHAFVTANQKALNADTKIGVCHLL